MLNTTNLPEISTYFIIKVKHTGGELALGPYIYLSEATNILLDHLELILKMYKVANSYSADLSEYCIENNDYLLIKTILQEEGNINA